jgi:hypothetical protein
MMELQVNLQEATMMGSEENVNEVDQVLSTYQLRLNDMSHEADAYLTCANNTFFTCDKFLTPHTDAF